MNILLAIALVALVSGVAVLWFFSRAAEAPAVEPPSRAWQGDTVTPMIQGRRNKAPERVARSFVVGQGSLLALHMARVDGTILQVERDAVRSFILERVTQADPEMAEQALRSAEAGIENAIEVERAIEGLRAVSSEQQRELLVDLLVHVAQADGVIHEAEVALLKRIGGMLGLSDETVEQRIAIDGGS